jgi:hypothetical protein
MKASLTASIDRLSIIAAALTWLAACGPARISGDGRQPGAAGGGPAGSDPDPTGMVPAFRLPDGGGLLDAAAAGRPDASCGLQRHRLTRLSPELLLVLDRSGSMREAAGGGSPRSRWEETTAALDEVLARTDGSIAWGLKSFPTPEGCEVLPDVEVPIGPLSQPVLAAVRMTQPNDGAAGTPTSAAIEAGTLYLRSLRSRNPRYLVLATDGLPTCPGDHLLAQRNTVAAVAAARTAGFPTFVIGIATAGTEADQVLGEMATAGGQPRAGAPAYYPVDDRQSLVSALAQIARVVETCTFPLDRDAPSPDDVAVNVDGVRIMRDATRRNGWDYGAGNREIELHGAACEIVKSGGVLNLEIIFGCPHVPIP